MSQYQYNPGQHDDKVQMKTGNFVLSIVGFTRGVGRTSGVPYVRARIEGVSPAVRGGIFTTTFSFSALWKLDRVGKAIGLKQGFDLMDDALLLKAFCGKPFKAQVVLDGRYHDLGLVYPWREGDPAEADLVGWEPSENTGKMIAPRERTGNGGDGGWGQPDDGWTDDNDAPGNGWADDPGPSDSDRPQQGGDDDLPVYDYNEGVPADDDDDFPF